MNYMHQKLIVLLLPFSIKGMFHTVSKNTLIIRPVTGLHTINMRNFSIQNNTLGTLKKDKLQASLRKAIEHDQVHFARLLIKAGAPINRQDMESYEQGTIW